MRRNAALHGMLGGEWKVTNRTMFLVQSKFNLTL